MPGREDVFQKAMNEGHSAAWDQEWDQAIQAYGRAVQEFGDDPEAHIHLGLGLLEMGRLEDALKVYTRAHQLAPDDPIPLEKSADVLERMGRLREAAQQYVNVSEVYLSQRDLAKAIGNWERATHLTPGLIPVHAKLAQAYDGAYAGRDLIFTRLSPQGSNTKLYKGGTAQNIWIHRGNTEANGKSTEAVPLTADYKGTSRSPKVHGQRVFFVSDRVSPPGSSAPRSSRRKERMYRRIGPPSPRR